MPAAADCWGINDLSVFGDYSAQALMHETTMQLLVRLKTVGDLSLLVWVKVWVKSVPTGRPQPLCSLVSITVFYSW